MMLEGPIDLEVLDGRIARAQKAVERDRARLATEEGRSEARIVDPFEGFRDVAGQATFKALRALEPGPIQAPHRDALLRWVYELLQTRVGWDLIVDEADAMHAPDPSLGRRAVKEGEAGIAKSEGEALRALVDAPHGAAADLALRRLEDLASPVAAVRKELRARRFEAARRLGLEHPWALAVTTAPEASSARTLERLAHAVLDATEPLATELHKELRRRSGAAVSPAHTIHEAFARDAREGWPAHLGARWLEDVFRAIAPRPPRVDRLPRAIGGASFLRAASVWGAALRQAGTARTLPFALAHDPYPTEAHVFGGALAITVADRVFAKRKLGLPARPADAHARALGRVLFFALRTTASNLALGMSESVTDEAEELSARVFGAPLPRALAAAWSYGGFAGTSRVEAPARLVGAVRSHGLVKNLVERFDEDWFDNPRVGSHLAGMAAGPIGPGEVPDADAVRAIARAFEESLG